MKIVIIIMQLLLIFVSLYFISILKICNLFLGQYSLIKIIDYSWYFRSFTWTIETWKI